MKIVLVYSHRNFLIWYRVRGLKSSEPNGWIRIQTEQLDPDVAENLDPEQK